MNNRQKEVFNYLQAQRQAWRESLLAEQKPEIKSKPKLDASHLIEAICDYHDRQERLEYALRIVMGLGLTLLTLSLLW